MTHDQIDRLVRKANPLPDPTALEPVDVPVLATPLERRTDMQTDNRQVTEGGGQNRRRGPLVGIAAAAVILIAGLVFVLTRDDTPVAEPAPNATQISADPDIDAQLTPGAYFVDTDGDDASSLRGTFVIEGSGWTSTPSGAVKEGFADNFAALLIVEVDQVWSPACASPAPAPQAAGSTAADLANQIAANGFTVRDALAPVSAFGHDGQHLRVDVPDSCSGESHMAWGGPVFEGRYYQENGQTVEYWFLDVGDTPVMVEANWYPGSSPEEDVAELRGMLDTLVITR
ncbi:MAG: hypothetical protein ACRDXF_10865 [Acidimicrobiia bacterium]